MEERIYTVVIERAEEGGYWARVPALSGCFTQAETLEGAVASAKEAIEGFVEMLVKLGKPLPIERAHPRQSTFSIEVKTPAHA